MRSPGFDVRRHVSPCSRFTILSLCCWTPPKAILEDAGKIFSPRMLASSTLRECGLLDRTLALRTQNHTSGKILQHAKLQVNAFRERLGASLCIFKVGVTANPPARFVSYKLKGFTNMWIVHKSDHVQEIHMLEAALISEHHLTSGCKNAAHSGGEGALNRKNSDGPPFFVYVAGGRADQRRWVG